MSVECPPGFESDPTLRLPSKPRDSITTDDDTGTYVRTTYEWVEQDNTARASCGCGQSCGFNMTYGVNAEGHIIVTPGGVGGDIGGGETTSTELNINVGSEEFEYVGIKCVLQETIETGEFSTSGGFQEDTLWNRVKFAWNFLFDGPAAIVPTITYEDPDDTEINFIQAGWKICRKPCR